MLASPVMLPPGRADSGRQGRGANELDAASDAGRPPTDAERLWLTVPNRLTVICGRWREGEKGSAWQRGPMDDAVGAAASALLIGDDCARNVRINYAVFADKWGQER